MNQYQYAATRLHNFMIANHLNGGALLGPDPGIRVNYRLGRFLKGYLPFVPWRDDLYYLQGQGYWVLANWLLAEGAGRQVYRDLAVQASDQMLARQRGDGAWDYPNPEWHGRVANAEGTWGAIGLLATYRQTGEARFLEAVLRWHRYMIDEVGFQRTGDQLAVNYFGAREGSRVPNNSAFVLHFLADLADVTGEPTFREPCRGMLRFMADVHMPSGEFPYSVKGPEGGRDRPHYQCFQYNAFQGFDLMRYWELTRDANALPLVRHNLQFLKTGQAADGHARYECADSHRAVTYHAAVLGAAFLKASENAMGDYRREAESAYAYVLRQQRSDGSLPHSRGDYRVLSDRRNYPRYQAMILYHLMYAASGEERGRKQDTSGARRAESHETNGAAPVVAAQDVSGKRGPDGAGAMSRKQDR